MQNRPDFTVKDANVTQSGKLIRLFGEHAPDDQGRVFSASILVENGKFEKMARTTVEEGGKSRVKVEGLIGAVIKEPVLRNKNTAKEGEEPSWITYLHEGKVTFPKSGKEFGYKETPLPPKEEQQQSAAAPGM